MYYNYRQHLELLTDEQRGRLLIALMNFGEYGEIPDFNNDGMLQMAFSFISAQLERDNEKYSETCKKRAENIKKRWEKSKDDNTNDTSV